MVTRLALAITGIILSAGVATAMPIQWTDPGGNDHWYEAVSAPNISWDAANAAAGTYFGGTGYLATLTSGAENAFVFSLLPSADLPYWLGGFQPPGSPEPDGGWQWVTGEAWSFTNWAAGEPTDGLEDALAFAFFVANGTWNDAPSDFVGYSNGGFVVESSAPSVPEPASLLLLGTGLMGLVRRQLRPLAMKAFFSVPPLTELGIP